MKKLLLKALKQEQYEYRKLSEKYLDQTAEFATKLFIKKEPMARALNLQFEDLSALVHSLCEVSINDGAGVIAINKETDRVVAFFVGKDFLSELPAVPGEKALPVFEFLDIFSQDLMQRGPIKTKDICHIIMAGVSTGQIERGPFSFLTQGLIGHQMGTFFLNQIRQCGYKEAYAECTGLKSQRGSSYYASRRKEIKYSEYRDSSGDNPFQNISEVKCVSFLMSL